MNNPAAFHVNGCMLARAQVLQSCELTPTAARSLACEEASEDSFWAYPREKRGTAARGARAAAGRTAGVRRAVARRPVRNMVSGMWVMTEGMQRRDDSRSPLPQPRLAWRRLIPTSQPDITNGERKKVPPGGGHVRLWQRIRQSPSLPGRPDQLAHQACMHREALGNGRDTLFAHTNTYIMSF